MAINFDALAKEPPKTAYVIPKGVYAGVIENAEMKASRSTGKDYLSVLWALKDQNTGKSVGKLYDNFSESDSPYVQSKLFTFMTTLKIDLGKSFELKDLSKVIKGKSCLVNITVDERDAENPKSQVNIFEHPYAPLTMPIPEEAEPAFNVNADEDLPFAPANHAEPVDNSAENY